MNNLAGVAEQQQTVSELAKLLHQRITDASRTPAGIQQNQFKNSRRVPQR
jgi:hypothetical protein